MRHGPFGVIASKFGIWNLEICLAAIVYSRLQRLEKASAGSCVSSQSSSSPIYMIQSSPTTTIFDRLIFHPDIKKGTVQFSQISKESILNISTSFTNSNDCFRTCLLQDPFGPSSGSNLSSIFPTSNSTWPISIHLTFQS